SAQVLTVYAQDANGCSATATVNIDALNTLQGIAIAQTAPISCTAPETVEVTVSGGSGDYTFTLLPTGPSQSIVGSTASFDLPTPGNYSFQVTDNVTGCTLTSAPYTVAPYDLGEVAITATAPVSCYGGTDGTLTFDVTGYSGSYNYQVLDASGNPVATGTANTTSGPLTVTGLPAGAYSVQVSETQHPFCGSVSGVATVQEPNQALTLNATITSPLTCNGNDAQISAFATGGWGNYIFELVDATTNTILVAYSSNNIFSGLGAGSYIINVKDDKGCIVSQTIDILDLVPISVTATATSVLCFGDTNGTVTATASGGQGPGSYMYVLTDANGNVSAPQSNPVFNNLPPGTYTVTVFDNLNCYSPVSNAVVIQNPNEVFVNVTLTSAMTCTNLAVITVTGSNGVPPYQYSDDGINFGTGNTFSVGAGSYQFFVQDANGCISSASSEVIIPVIDPLEIQLDLNNAVINCTGGSDASVQVHASGALGNYIYSLYDISNLSTPMQGPQASNYFNNIPAGNYEIRVSSGDCPVESVFFNIQDPPVINASIQVENISCFGETDGSITVNATGGTGTIMYSLDQNQYFTEGIFNNLTAGTYTVFVQDEAGCSPAGSPFSVTITEPAQIQAVTTVVAQEICEGDDNASISIQISGGTLPYKISLTGINGDYVPVQGNMMVFNNLNGGESINFFIKDANGCEITTLAVTLDEPINLTAAYSVIQKCDNINTINVEVADPVLAQDVMYALNGGDLQTSNVFDNVPPGTHSIQILHASGCSFWIDNIEIEAIPLLDLISVINTGLNQYTVNAEGGTPIFEYQMNDGPLTMDPVFEINESGFHTFTVVDSRGCLASVQLYIDFLDIFIGNYFSPNDDGTNDYWKPENLPPNASVLIFDRYSRKIVEFTADYTGWDGTYQGKKLPSGDYWYWIKLNDETDREIKGHFTLIR
ncbi:MAG TPA: T9SS type B sorting domain-containing protein, partial [Flavobacteriaceae bacterium]|nr:T9SS type B sorting domain-containing protein [Flavobacteriaceae bacterium]